MSGKLHTSTKEEKKKKLHYRHATEKHSCPIRSNLWFPLLYNWTTLRYYVGNLDRTKHLYGTLFFIILEKSGLAGVGLQANIENRHLSAPKIYMYNNWKLINSLPLQQQGMSCQSNKNVIKHEYITLWTSLRRMRDSYIFSQATFHFYIALSTILCWLKVACKTF